jgi:hypothetical protein
MSALEEPAKTCRVCHGPMAPGYALLNTLVGYPDFPGEHYAATMSATGPAVMVPCLKCSQCGHSVRA